jgi:hypothetical protein
LDESASAGAARLAQLAAVAPTPTDNAKYDQEIATNARKWEPSLIILQPSLRDCAYKLAELLANQYASGG